nr:MAG TPA: hypothetical protein [Bacteriophage sp.]
MLTPAKWSKPPYLQGISQICRFESACFARVIYSNFTRKTDRFTRNLPETTALFYLRPPK